eukprot:204927_1
MRRSIQSLLRQNSQDLQRISHPHSLSIRRHFSKHTIPGKTFKTDCWPGLENTRTYVRGYVKEWNINEGCGILIDSEEKDCDYRTQCQYYVHWSDIAGLNIKHLETGAPVAFEVVQEDRNNRFHRNIPRSHMYQETRPKFRTYRRNHDSNKVRAINVHQLNRINWETDCIQMDEQNKNDHEDDSDLLDKNSQLETVSDDVLKSVKYRNDIRKRDIQNGHSTVDKIKRKHGDHVDVNIKSLDEIEGDETEKQKYYEKKNYKQRSYPYAYRETDIYEQDLVKYPQWFPEIAKKHNKT